MNKKQVFLWTFCLLGFLAAISFVLNNEPSHRSVQAEQTAEPQNLQTDIIPQVLPPIAAAAENKTTPPIPINDNHKLNCSLPLPIIYLCEPFDHQIFQICSQGTKINCSGEQTCGFAVCKNANDCQNITGVTPIHRLRDPNYGFPQAATIVMDYQYLKMTSCR